MQSAQNYCYNDGNMCHNLFGCVIIEEIHLFFILRSPYTILLTPKPYLAFETYFFFGGGHTFNTF